MGRRGAPSPGTATPGRCASGPCCTRGNSVPATGGPPPSGGSDPERPVDTPGSCTAHRTTHGRWRYGGGNGFVTPNSVTAPRRVGRPSPPRGRHASPGRGDHGGRQPLRFREDHQPAQHRTTVEVRNHIEPVVQARHGPREMVGLPQPHWVRAGGQERRLLAGRMPRLGAACAACAARVQQPVDGRPGRVVAASSPAAGAFGAADQAHLLAEPVTPARCARSTDIMAGRSEEVLNLGKP